MLVLVFYLAFILYYSSLYGFSKLTKLIIYFVYLYLGDLKTSLNKDKEPLKLKFNNMDYLDEKTLNIALFDKFYCINVICFIGYVGSFIYGIVYLSMEGNLLDNFRGYWRDNISNDWIISRNTVNFGEIWRN